LKNVQYRNLYFARILYLVIFVVFDQHFYPLIAFDWVLESPKLFEFDVLRVGICLIDELNMKSNFLWMLSVGIG